MLSRVVKIADISECQKDRMHTLMEQYFEGVDRAAFEADLRDKQWAILLTDEDQLCGFSTLCLMEDVVDNQQVRAFFSGDTIIDRAHWGSLALENAWAEFVFSQITPYARWFWFLICKGYRTYRYLPVYFKHYYPSPNQTAPAFEQRVLDTLAKRRYDSCYCAQTGTIHSQNDYKLRAGVGDITAKELKDPRIAFFQERNPAWREGVELACLAELSPANLTKPAARFLGRDSAK